MVNTEESMDVLMYDAPRVKPMEFMLVVICIRCFKLLPMEN